MVIVDSRQRLGNKWASTVGAKAEATVEAISEATIQAASEVSNKPTIGVLNLAMEATAEVDTSVAAGATIEGAFRPAIHTYAFRKTWVPWPHIRGPSSTVERHNELGHCH